MTKETAESIQEKLDALRALEFKNAGRTKHEIAVAFGKRIYEMDSLLAKARYIYKNSEVPLPEFRMQLLRNFRHPAKKPLPLRWVPPYTVELASALYELDISAAKNTYDKRLAILSAIKTETYHHSHHERLLHKKRADAAKALDMREAKQTFRKIGEALGVGTERARHLVYYARQQQQMTALDRAWDELPYATKDELVFRVRGTHICESQPPGPQEILTKIDILQLAPVLTNIKYIQLLAWLERHKNL